MKPYKILLMRGQFSIFRLAIKVVTLLFVFECLGVAPAPAQTKKREISRLHFRRGMEAFERGNYDEALIQYEKAYSVMPLPGMLFNIGQCYRNLNHPEKAIYYFEMYLEKKPEAENRVAVEGLIKDLHGKIEAKKKKEKELARKKSISVYVPPDKTKKNIIDLTSKPVQPITPGKPIYKRWWFWPSIAVVAVGVPTVLFFSLYKFPPEYPSADFEVDFRR